MTTVIVWFRNDLRVADNPALHHALAAGAQVIPLYIHAPDEQAPWPPGAASRWWLHHSLIALNETIVRLGSRLIVRRGPTLATLHSLIRQTDASQLYCSRTYEPVTECRDRDILRELAAAGVRCTQYNASLLHEPGSVLNKDGHPYKVFTPFWRACQWHADATMPLSSPSAMPLPPRTIESSAIVGLGCITFRIPAKNRSTRVFAIFLGVRTMHCYGRGSAAVPASPSSTPACASCGRLAGCITASV